MSSSNEISYLELQNLEEIEDIRDINKNRFKVGDLFLHGENVIEQKNTKNPGDTVTIYQITEIGESTTVYFPKYYKIKEERKNA